MNQVFNCFFSALFDKKKKMDFTFTIYEVYSYLQHMKTFFFLGVFIVKNGGFTGIKSCF